MFPREGVLPWTDNRIDRWHHITEWQVESPLAAARATKNEKVRRVDIKGGGNSKGNKWRCSKQAVVCGVVQVKARGQTVWRQFSVHSLKLSGDGVHNVKSNTTHGRFVAELSGGDPNLQSFWIVQLFGRVGCSCLAELGTELPWPLAPGPASSLKIASGFGHKSKIHCVKIWKGCGVCTYSPRIV